MTSAWMPLMKRSYSTSMAATAASSSSFPSTTSPSSKKASRCAGVRCRAARATAAHASHDKARRIVRCAQSGAAQALPMSFGGPRPQYEYDVLVGAFARRAATTTVI